MCQTCFERWMLRWVSKWLSTTLWIWTRSARWEMTRWTKPKHHWFHDTYPIRLLRSNYSSRWTVWWVTVSEGLKFSLHMNLVIFLTLYSCTLISNWKTIIYLCIAPTYEENNHLCISDTITQQCFQVLKNAVVPIFVCSYLNAWAWSNVICMYPYLYTSDYILKKNHPPRSEAPIGLKRLFYQS